VFEILFIRHWLWLLCGDINKALLSRCKTPWAKACRTLSEMRLIVTKARQYSATQSKTNLGHSIATKCRACFRDILIINVLFSVKINIEESVINKYVHSVTSVTWIQVKVMHRIWGRDWTKAWSLMLRVTQDTAKERQVWSFQNQDQKKAFRRVPQTTPFKPKGNITSFMFLCCCVCRLRQLVNGRSSGMHQSASFSSSSTPVLTYGATVLHCGSQHHMETSHTGSVLSFSPLTSDLCCCLNFEQFSTPSSNWATQPRWLRRLFFVF